MKIFKKKILMRFLIKCVKVINRVLVLKISRKIQCENFLILFLSFNIYKNMFITIYLYL